MSNCCVYISKACGHTAKDVASRLGLVESTAESVRSINEPFEIEVDEVACAQAEDWHILFSRSGPFLDADPTERLQALSYRGRVVFWLTQSTSGGLWFELCERGVLKRKWIEVESEVAENVGEPLPAEPEQLFGDAMDDKGIRDEWAVIGVVEKVTGISWEKFSCLQFEVFPVTRSGCDLLPRAYSSTDHE